MPGITIVNKSLTPINVVVVHYGLLDKPTGFGCHMNIPPSGRQELDIGTSLMNQCRIYVWGGGSPGTEMSEDKIKALVAARWAASDAISYATVGVHGLISGVIESTVADVCQEVILNHIATEVITSQSFEKAIEKGVSFALKKGVVDGAITPKEWGVCSEYFLAVVSDEVRYVYGGPTIYNEKYAFGWELSLKRHNTGYDPVTVLKQLKRDEEETINTMSDAAKIARWGYTAS